MNKLKKLLNLIPIPSYTVIILCFFFPFVLIKCGDRTLLSVKGTDLITGISKKTMDKRIKGTIKENSIFGSVIGDSKKTSTPTDSEYSPLDSKKNKSKEKGSISPNLFIIISLLSAIVGIIVQIVKSVRKKHIYNIILSLIGFFSLLIFYWSFNNLGSNGLGMKMKLGISYTFGFSFYLCTVLFLLLILFYGISSFFLKNRKEST